jgi:glycosyltransferase involved in cell wall biosynthesis
MSAGRPKVSIIVTTYNWPAALGLVLQSALAQSEPAFELVIADDGSDSATAEVVVRTLGDSATRWCHVRHADAGIRQSRVRNLGVRNSTAPLLIFIDHDTLLHSEFVADHVRLAGEGLFVQGKRCLLPTATTARLVQDGLRTDWWPSPWSPGLVNRKNAWRWPALGRWFASPRRFQTSIRSCNLAVRREHFLQVDGFDETFDGEWGREDSDLAYRLFHSGVRCRNAWFVALQAHLDHPWLKRRQRGVLDDEIDRVRRDRRTRAVRGLSQLDSEGTIVAASADFRSV